MAYHQQTPIRQPKQPYFTPSEMNKLLTNSHIEHIKLALSNCERALHKMINRDGFTDEMPLIDSLTAVKDLRTTIHVMELIDEKKLGVLTEEMLFQNEEARNQYQQNVSISKPALKPFNYLLHMTPKHWEQEDYLSKNKNIRSKPIYSPIFFEHEVYDCLPNKISADDLLYHSECTDPNILNKNYFMRSLQQLHHDENQTYDYNKDSLTFKENLDTLWYHIRQSNIPDLVQKQSLGTGPN